MKVSVSASELRKALAMIAKHADDGMIIPVLGRVLIQNVGDSVIQLKSTNLNVWASARIPADVQSPGSALPSAHVMAALAGKIQGDAAVTLELDNDTLILRSGKSKSRMPCLSIMDFPEIPTIENPHSFEIELRELTRLIRSTVFACCVDKTRTYLDGIYLSFGEKGLRATATNGNRLAVAYSAVPNSGMEGVGAIIPSKSAEGLLAFCKGVEGNATICINQSHVSVALPSGDILLTRTVDGTFPDVERIIPRQARFTPRVDRESLSSALGSAKILADERTRSIKLSFSDEGLNVVVMSADKGDGRFPVDAEFDGPSFEIGMNSEYLGDAIDSLSSDTVIFGFNSSGDPLTIKPSLENPDVNVIMPVRI